MANMKIVFATEALRNECNNQEQLIKRHGANSARLVRQRLDELFNAEVLADMRSMPHVTLIAGEGSALALEVGLRLHLVFRPAMPPGADGEWDWKKVDSLVVMGLVRP
jgi:hypothetical protein